jgi:membrane glycosyltransferase
MSIGFDPSSSRMPPRAPLDMPAQDFRAAPLTRSPHDLKQPNMVWRFAVFLPAVLATAALLFAIYGWLSSGGMMGLEYGLLFLIGLMFLWVSLSVSTALVGLFGPPRTRGQADGADGAVPFVAPLSVGLLVPVYNETAADVFGNAAAMLNDLADLRTRHTFTLFILSDTQDPMIAAQEEMAYALLRAQTPAQQGIFYRRRAQNTDKKIGNLVDWVTGWGAGYDAMLVLDADSLMDARSIGQLADALAEDPSAGLIQSFPNLIAAQTLFARVQQFSCAAYGWLLADGLARWAQHDSNYWGHNAIMRTRAFASAAGLPHLRGLRGQDQLIMSHDFVEAALLRRAGWGVRFLPRLSGSFEETPPTLIDYVLRDRRWCRGNLQHLRLVGARGFHPVSRFHLLHGAVSYLLSPAWFVLLVIWALLGTGAESNVIHYFNEANPLFPEWPEISQIHSVVFLLIMYSMLLTPKITGAAAIAFSPIARTAFGGARVFLGAVGVEVAASVAYAPVLMVQQTQAVVRAMIGRTGGWVPQQRALRHYDVRTLLAFHWFETLVGVVLTVGLVSGLVSLWLAPIAASLLLAVPLSALSAFNLAHRARGSWRLDSPHTLNEPEIVVRARAQRARMQAALANRAPTFIAAE